MDIVPIAIIAIVIQKLIERLREVYPKVDGLVCTALATGLGVLFAFAGHIGVFAAMVPDYQWPWWLDQAITGIGLGAGAGWFSDLAGRSGPRAE